MKKAYYFLTKTAFGLNILMVAFFLTMAIYTNLPLLWIVTIIIASMLPACSRIKE